MWKKRRNHPCDDSVFGVTLALDVALLVHIKATSHNHLCRNRQIPIWQDYPVKRELEVAFTEEMSRLLIGFQMSTPHSSSAQPPPADPLRGPHGHPNTCPT